MLKIIFPLFFSLSLFGASVDSIDLTSSVDPVCSVDFTPEPVASNLDITTSANHLLITTFDLYSNLEGSTSHQGHVDFDLSGSLVHSNNINQFNFDSFDMEYGTDEWLGAPSPFIMHDNFNSSHESGSFFINYTGVPAISLMQGTYTAQWFVSCSVEPRE